MEKRISWNSYFMNIAKMVAERSTCNRARIGAVIVKEKNILATGYNGAPAGLPHCLEEGCLVYVSKNPDGEEEENCFRTIHAEINSIAQAAKHGVSISGADIYVTASPCYHCLKVLINVGIKNIFYFKPYKIHNIQEMIDTAKVNLIQINE
jgi:dCMP deaminase